MRQEPRGRWWKAPDGEVNRELLLYVAEVERQQSYLFERFYRLRCLYDPYFQFLSGYGGYYETERQYNATVTENVVASTVDTVTAVVAASEVRPRIMTDDADFSTQRRARHLEWYAEGIAKLLDLHSLSTLAFKEAALVGTGLIKISEDLTTKRPRAELALVDDIVVDEAEVRRGKAMQMTHRVFIDRDELIAAFPDHEEAIRDARDNLTQLGMDWRFWAGYRPYQDNQVVVLESWRLGVGGEPGRHVIAIEGVDLLDEPWTKDYFPFAVMRWQERRPGWYGVGGAERIAGHQRRLNKMNWQEDRVRDLHAMPIQWIQFADRDIAVKSRNGLGQLAVYKGAKPPVTVFPPAANPDQVERRRELKQSALEEVGVSPLTATARKPAGLESGAALREYRDSTTQRFATQEKAHERMFLDAIWIALDICRDLGDDAPVIVRKTPSAPRRLVWSKVDMTETRVQLAAASNLNRTPAGRVQQVLEFAQAGIISQDEARRLIRHPDIARAMSMYTAALENIEAIIEEMLDGKRMFPEPYQNLQMGVWRVQMAYLKASNDGAPDRILENLRQWMVQASFILNPPQPMVDPTMAAGPELAPEEMGSAPELGALPAAPPVEAPPQAAFSPQAMNLAAE